MESSRGRATYLYRYNLNRNASYRNPSFEVYLKEALLQALRNNYNTHCK